MTLTKTSDQHFWKPLDAIAWSGILLIFTATFIAYSPAIQGKFIWDDDLYAANPLLTQPHGLRQIWTLQQTPQHYYREFPVVYTSFWLERRLWGLDTAGYHLVNIALHALNALLVWFILKKIGLGGAWLAAGIFALHPVHVESVAWIAERKNVLSGFFYLLALISYLRFEGTYSHRWYLSSLAFFALALLSKSITCTLPAVLLLLRWERGLEIDRRMMKNLFPFFLIALGMGIFTLTVEVPMTSKIHITLMQRALLIAHNMWFYPMKLAWPTHLSFSYEKWTLNTQDFFQWLWFFGALGVWAWLWRQRNRLDRGILTGLCFYMITIAPLLGFFNVYTFRFAYVADHYQYLASLGLIAACVGSLEWQLRKDRWIFILTGTVVLSLCGTMTWQQAHVYKNNETLWQDVLTENPDSAFAHHNLGIALAERDQWKDAIAHLRTAEALDPTFPQTHLALAYFAVHAKRWDDARHQYQEAIRLGIRDPDVLKDFASLRRMKERQ